MTRSGSSRLTAVAKSETRTCINWHFFLNKGFLWLVSEWNINQVNPVPIAMSFTSQKSSTRTILSQERRWWWWPRYEIQSNSFPEGGDATLNWPLFAERGPIYFLFREQDVNKVKGESEYNVPYLPIAVCSTEQLYQFRFLPWIAVTSLACFFSWETNVKERSLYDVWVRSQSTCLSEETSILYQLSFLVAFIRKCIITLSRDWYGNVKGL